MKKAFKLIFGFMLVLALTFSIGINSNTAVAVQQAFGTSIVSTVDNYGQDTRATRRNDFQVPKRVKLGDEIKLPTNSKLIAPTGEDVTGNGGSVRATQVGFYSLQLDENSYKYSIECYAEQDRQPILVIGDEINGTIIDNDGAGLPAIIDAGIGSLDLPKARAIAYDRNDDEVDLSSPTNDVLVEVSNATLANGKITVENRNTTFFVRYSFGGGDTGFPYVYRDFSVKVQQGLNDTRDAEQDKPTINVAAPSNSANINTKVDLPKATGNDKYDKILKYSISVTGPNGNVKKVTVDYKTGYASGVLQDDEIFDNNRNMSFYPTVVGAYTVTYKAVNSVGYEAKDISYTINVVDKSAPIIKDIVEGKDANGKLHQIPSNWGVSVSRIKTDANGYVTDNNHNYEADELTGNDLKVYFPTLEQIDVYDNLSSVDSTDNKLTVSMTMTNPQGDIIYNYSDLSNTAQNNLAKLGFAEGDDNSKTLNDGFSFIEYSSWLDRENGNRTVEGDYTVTYRARDNENQVSTRTYKINIQTSFVDTTPPFFDKSTFEDLQGWILADDRLDFTIPSAMASDTQTAKPYGGLIANYTIQDDASTPNVVKLSGGEKLVYLEDDGNGQAGIFATKLSKPRDILAENADKASVGGTRLNPNSKLTIRYNAYDSVGNFLVDPNEKVEANNQKEIAVYDTNTKITLGSIIVDGSSSNDKTNAKADFIVNPGSSAGDISVTGTNATDIAGVEVSVLYVKDEDGRQLANPAEINNVELTHTLKTDAINLSAISFSPIANGDYEIIVRAFDINGNQSIGKADYTADRADNNWTGSRVNTTAVDTRSIAELPTQTELGDSYRLPTYRFGGTPTHHNRTIKGGAFELMGDVFTPKNTVTYIFDDKDDNGTQLGNGKYYTAVIVSDTPTISLVNNALRQHVERDENNNTTKRIDLPQIVAQTKTGSAILDIPKVVYNDRDDMTVSTDTSGRFFTARRDGKYTITYTATYRDRTATLVLTVYVGKITAPAFRLNEGDSLTRSYYDLSKSGDDNRFNFAKIELIGTIDADALKDYNVVKTLFDPTHQEVAKVDGTGQSALDRINNGSAYAIDKAGRWEVRYTVTDNDGNSTDMIRTITVDAASNRAGISAAVISTVLIVVGVVLIFGAFLYLIKFRRIKVPTDYKPKTTTKTVNKTTTKKVAEQVPQTQSQPQIPEQKTTPTEAVATTRIEQLLQQQSQPQEDIVVSNATDDQSNTDDNN